MSGCDTGPARRFCVTLVSGSRPIRSSSSAGRRGPARLRCCGCCSLGCAPTRGLITLFDHDTATLSKDSLAVLRRRIGIVFQDFRLLDHLTTFDNVALPLKVLGRKEETYYDEVTDLLG